jgi:predicted phage terminase large subunit-like protein
MLVQIPPSRQEIDLQIRAENARRSLSCFTQEMWPVIEPGVPLRWNWHMDCVCSHLQAVTEGHIRKLIILIPPGHCKSTLVSVMWQAWEWIDYPYMRTLFGSYDESLTHRDSMKCRSIIKSPKYQRFFRPDWSISKDQDTKGYFSNTYQGSRKTYYVASRKKTGWRGNHVVIDDPLSAEDRYNNQMKLDVIDSWETVLSTRVNDPSTAAFVVIMQRLADNDLAGYLMEKYGDKYVVVMLPAEFDPDRKCTTYIDDEIFFEDPRTEKGELLFDEMFPLPVIDDLKIRLGPVDYSAQFDHKPVPAGGDRFQSQYFQYWKYVPGSPLLVELNYRDGSGGHIKEYTRVDFLEKIMSLDPALTEKKTSDYTCMGLWAKTNKGELILLHRVKFKKDEAGIVAAAKELYSMQQWGKNPPSYIAVESNGLGIAVYQVLKNAGLPVKEVQVSKDKVVMSGVAVTRFQGGQIFLPDYDVAPWMHETVKELLSFPAGVHDDEVSMICIAANDVFAQTMMTPTSITTLNSTQKPAKFNPLKTQVNLEKRHLFGADKMTGGLNQDRMQGGKNGNGNGFRKH